jgi:hypothetical protein
MAVMVIKGGVLRVWRNAQPGERLLSGDERKMEDQLNVAETMRCKGLGLGLAIKLCTEREIRSGIQLFLRERERERGVVKRG